MSEANEAITRRFYKGLDAGDLSVVDEFISDDLVEHWGVTDTGAMMQQLTGA
jgi:predicted ester cyclase